MVGGISLILMVCQFDIPTKRLKNQSVPYFDIIKRLETIELDNIKSKKLLDDVVRIVIDMQDEAKENTRLIGFNR